MSKETGGSAFPVDRQCAHAQAMQSVGDGDETRYIEEVNKISGGMTLRDYFAAKAMQSFVSHLNGNYQENGSQRAYAWADAMLKAREEA